MQKVLFVALLLTNWSSAHATANIQCYNKATGAAFYARSTVGGTGPSNEGIFTMNLPLASTLNQQMHHGAQVALLSDTGLFAIDGSLQFWAGRPKAWTMALKGDHGGMMLTYLSWFEYTGWHTPPAQFYFNPGECREITKLNRSVK